MKLNLYNKNDVAVLELVGKVMAGKSVVLLDEKLYSLLGRGRKKVVIDLVRLPGFHPVPSPHCLITISSSKRLAAVLNWPISLTRSRRLLP